MKLLITLLLIGMTATAQIKGNGQQETRNFQAENLTDLEINLYADIIIDQNLKAGIQIATDTNLFEYIDTEVVNGILKLDQKEWIQPSQNIKITIGAPQIRRVLQGTNNEVRIVHLDVDRFNAMALNGSITISGKVQTLSLGSENGTINAKETLTKEIFLNIWGAGAAMLNTADDLQAKLSKEARLSFIEKPQRIKGSITHAIANANTTEKMEVRYLSFKIKNNSMNRHNFYVVGPKPDGKRFSYGFPMMPGTLRKEKWTTGTKIYKVGSLGIKKLLVTITDTDENTVVKLF